MQVKGQNLFTVKPCSSLFNLHTCEHVQGNILKQLCLSKVTSTACWLSSDMKAVCMLPVSLAWFATSLKSGKVLYSTAY